MPITSMPIKPAAISAGVASIRRYGRKIGPRMKPGRPRARSTGESHTRSLRPRPSRRVAPSTSAPLMMAPKTPPRRAFGIPRRAIPSAFPASPPASDARAEPGRNPSRAAGMVPTRAPISPPPIKPAMAAGIPKRCPVNQRPMSEPAIAPRIAAGMPNRPAPPRLPARAPPIVPRTFVPIQLAMAFRGAPKNATMAGPTSRLPRRDPAGPPRRNPRGPPMKRPAGAPRRVAGRRDASSPTVPPTSAPGMVSSGAPMSAPGTPPRMAKGMLPTTCPAR